MVFAANDLANMQAAQNGHMQDTCVIQTYSRTLDSYGSPVETYTDGPAIACGLEMTTGRENHRADMTVERIDATVRLPIGTSLQSTDRIKATRRFGTAITAIEFEIVGEVRCGPSGIRVDVSKVTP